MIGIGKMTKGHVFQLNPTKMTCLVATIDDSSLWHKSFFHINFDNIINVRTTFDARDFPKIVKPANMVCKECVITK